MSGAELRDRRTALGMTQRQLAERLGVSVNTVARWERGEMAIRHPQMVESVLRQLESAAGH